MATKGNEKSHRCDGAKIGCHHDPHLARRHIATGKHCGFCHQYHLVWSTEYRFKVLHGQLRVRVRDICRQVTDLLRSYREALRELGTYDKLETGSWANKRSENSC